MFCKKCGRPTEDNGIICRECAAMEKRPAADYFEDMPAIEPVFSADVQKEVPAELPVETAYFDPADTFELNTEGTVKASKKPLGLLIGVVAGLVAVVAAVVIGFNWNKIFKPYDTPEEHLAYVEAESAKDSLDSVTSLYGGVLNTIKGSDKKSGGTSTQMHIKLSDDAMDLISSFTDVDLDWANDILINLDTVSSGQKMKAALGIGLENTTIATADVLMDLDKYIMYLGIPELSGTYLEIDMEDLFSNMYGGNVYREDAYVSYASYAAAPVDWEDYSELVEALPTEQELNKILKKYVAVAFEAVGEVDSSSETITIDGVSQKCTALNMEFDQETLYNIMFEILNTAKKDKDLIDMILKVANSESIDLDLDENDITDAIEEAIEELEDAKDEVDEDEVLFELTDYVDSNERIIGRRIEIEDMDDIYYMTVTNNGKFAFEASFGDVMITGSGTNKKNILNGEYVIEIADEDVLIVELEKWDVKSFQSGNAVGTIRVKPSEEITQQIMSQVTGIGLSMDVALELVFNNSNAQKHIEVNILADEDFFAGITIDSKSNSNSKITFPKDAVDITDEDDLMDWAEDLDFDALIENMEDAGIPREYVRLIENALG